MIGWEGETSKSPRLELNGADLQMEEFHVCHWNPKLRQVRLCQLLMNAKESQSDTFLRVIAIFKLLKAFLFFCAGVGVLHFLHKDVEAWLMQVLDNSHVDSDNRAAQWCLKQADQLTSVKIGAISAICFFYGSLFATEGVGLYLRKRWAEYFVVIMTGSLLPLEAYELVHKFNWAKLALIAINLLILGYLIVVIRRKCDKQPVRGQ